VIDTLLEEQQVVLRKRIDRAFGWLMLAQWAVIIVLAWNLSVNNWIVFIAGSVLTILPLYFSFIKPGEKDSGYFIAVAQMGFSALFVHLLDGHMQAYFHIFGSLAFLSLYRNWRIVVLASAVIILDLALHDLMVLESSAWIAFEDVFLIYSCIHANIDMKKAAYTKSELINSRLDNENLNIRRIQFFSVISHEIRTPLSGIIGFSDFLKDSPLPDEQKEYVSIISQCSDTLLKLVNDLLDFSRIDSGRLDIDPHTFKIKDIILYLENVFSLECQKRNLQFHFEASNDIPEELVGDSHRIRQVLTNLVGNAIKFTESGSIQVMLKRQDPSSNFYCWSIADTGVGIHKDYLNQIFSPYTQEHSSTARQYGGSGLGLAISKKLVELMGGQLNVESTLGKGSTFYFTLPLKPS